MQERGEESLSSLKIKIKELENKLQQEKEQRTAELEERDMALAEKSEYSFQLYFILSWPQYVCQA